LGCSSATSAPLLSSFCVRKFLMTPLLDVKNLRVAFGGQAVVHGIDFRIGQGEKLALVGE